MSRLIQSNPNRLVFPCRQMVSQNWNNTLKRKMKNKIIAGVIAALFLPMLISLHWAVDQFLSVRVVLVIAMVVGIIILIYKFSKLLLDEYSEKRKRP